MEEKKTKIAEQAVTISIDNDFDDEQMTPVQQKVSRRRKAAESAESEPESSEKPLINCLRNERVIVRHINRPSSINDPRHVLFGRMHENSKITFVVPKLSSGAFVNVLTNDEKDFLENIMGLEKNALSIYKKIDNFWDDSLDNSLATVELGKHDNIFDMSNPEDYIRVKVLLANKDLIAPSYQAYLDAPKASYLFYVTSDGETSKRAIDNVSKKSAAYLELGKLSENKDKMKMVLELITGRQASPLSKADFFQVELSKCIEGNAAEFLRIISDPLLDTKVFICKCHEAGLISKKNDLYFLKRDGSPLCEMNENSTLNVAAKYLNAPKHQELLFSLQAQLNM